MITRRHHDWARVIPGGNGAQLRGEAAATFSDCEKYRYSLGRIWSERPPLIFVGLNPSTANELVEDPTIRRVIAMSLRLDCGGIVMLNLFALRSTDPKALYSAVEPIGADNDNEIMRTFTVAADTKGAVVVFGWGNHGQLMNRGRIVRALAMQNGITPLHLGLTQKREPKHPLYLPNAQQLIEWGLA